MGLRAYMANGRPTLDRRWDTLVYKEGLQSEQVDRQLGGARTEVKGVAISSTGVDKKATSLHVNLL